MQVAISPSEPPPQENPDLMQLAISPLAIPTIIHPIGIAAILAAILVDKGDPQSIMVVFVLLIIMMGLDYLAMRYA